MSKTFQIRHGRVLQTVTYTTTFCRTMTPRWIYGAMRRDLVNAAKLGNPYQPVVQEDLPTEVPIVGVDETVLTGGSLALTSQLPIGGLLTAGGAAVVTAFVPNDQSIPIIGGGTTMIPRAQTQCEQFDKDDDLTHTGSRADPQLRTLIEFWDGAAPGVAQTHLGTPAVGAYDVTVGSNNTLVVGQVLTANVSFPDGAVIVALKQAVQLVDGTGLTDRAGTTITLSRKAGGAATPEAFVFTGGTLLAWHTPESDIMGGGTFKTIR